MAKTIGRNTNVNDTGALSSAITLNSSTSVKIQDAAADRIYFIVTTPGSPAFWVKLQAASVDNDKDGIFVPAGQGFWEMPVDSIYTGEISAIADDDGLDVYTTEY